MSCKAMSLIIALCCVSHARVYADTRVTVHDFYGPNAQQMRDDVVNLLERQSGVTIIAKGQIASAAKKLGVDPYSPSGRIALSRELQLSAWMSGRVERQAGKLKLTLVVYDGAQHLRVGRAQLSGGSARKLSAQIKHHLWRKSRRALLRASAPDGPATDQVAAKAVDAEKSDEHTAQPATLPDDDVAQSSSTATTVHGQVLRAFVGVGSPYRSLAYSDAVTSTLGDYQLSGAPMADLNVAFYPGRLAGEGWQSWLAAEARGQFALSTPTTDRAGNKFDSSYQALYFGLRLRVPVGRHALAVFSGYGMSRYQISARDSQIALPAPSVDYRMIRSGLGTELALSDTVQLGLDAAWLNLLSVGGIGQWFPRASAAGLELSLFATYRMTSSVFARATAAYQRTFFDFNARPGDKYIAGGATDQTLALSLGAGINL